MHLVRPNRLISLQQRNVWSVIDRGKEISITTAHGKAVNVRRTNPRAYSTNTKSTQALVHQLLQTCTPSKREAKSYIKRYDLGPAKDYYQSTTNPIHIALVQLHWPLSHQESVSVANTLVALQRLTVVPVILINLDPLHPDVHSTTATDLIPDFVQTDFCTFRDLYMQACHQVSKILDSAGTVSRPLYTNVFHITTTEPELVPTVDVSPLQSCLENKIVPILAPIATSWDTSQTVPLSIANAMMALAASLSSNPKVSFLGPLGPDASQLNPTQQFIRRCVPTKLILINRSRGGIPFSSNRDCSAVSGRAFINLAMEFDTINKTLDTDAKDDLCQTHRVLSLMTTSATAMIVSASTSETIVSHFLTDKPLVSVSLPQRSKPPPPFTITPNHLDQTLDQPPPIPPTVCRLGVPIHILTDFNTINQHKLTALLESSFKRKLDTFPYYARLEKNMSTVIIAGDYVGAVIITNETGVPYLDKFAVSPKVQSGGVADILWMTLRNTVCTNTLIWRSRHSNQVNHWYFARADGMLKLKSVNLGDWTVFWYTQQHKKSLRHWTVPVDTYLKVANAVPPSFLVQ